MIIRAFLMSLGMFSVIPAPKNSWDDACAPLMMPVLPAVGAIIGLIWYAAARLIADTAHPVLAAALILLIPFFLSGLLHLDGFMDTADAIFSRRPLEERRRILKDPHTGAFAVAAAICLFLLQYCAVYVVIDGAKTLTALIFIPVLSRAAAGLALLRLRPLSETGYLATFKANTKTVYAAAPILCAALCLVPAYFFGALPVLAAEALAAGCVTAYVYRQMGGLSGDLCGCIITCSELAALVCMAVL